MANFRKPVLAVGRYRTRSGEWLDATPARLQGWSDKFRAMRRDGITLPLSWGHQPQAEPEDPFADPNDPAVKARREFGSSAYCAGQLDDLEYDPASKTLYAKGSAPGADIDDDGNLLAWVKMPDGTQLRSAVNEVSIGVNNWVDGKGRLHEDVPIHLALCVRPVAHGLGGFLALSTETRSPCPPGHELRCTATGCECRPVPLLAFSTWGGSVIEMAGWVNATTGKTRYQANAPKSRDGSAWAPKAGRQNGQPAPAPQQAQQQAPAPAPAPGQPAPAPAAPPAAPMSYVAQTHAALSAGQSMQGKGIAEQFAERAFHRGHDDPESVKKAMILGRQLAAAVPPGTHKKGSEHHAALNAALDKHFPHGGPAAVKAAKQTIGMPKLAAAVAKHSQPAKPGDRPAPVDSKTQIGASIKKAFGIIGKGAFSDGLVDVTHANLHAGKSMGKMGISEQFAEKAFQRGHKSKDDVKRAMTLAEEARAGKNPGEQLTGPPLQKALMSALDKHFPHGGPAAVAKLASPQPAAKSQPAIPVASPADDAARNMAEAKRTASQQAPAASKQPVAAGQPAVSRHKTEAYIGGLPKGEKDKLFKQWSNAATGLDYRDWVHRELHSGGLEPKAVSQAAAAVARPAPGWAAKNMAAAKAAVKAKEQAPLVASPADDAARNLAEAKRTASQQARSASSTRRSAAPSVAAAAQTGAQTGAKPALNRRKPAQTGAKGTPGLSGIHQQLLSGKAVAPAKMPPHVNDKAARSAWGHGFLQKAFKRGHRDPESLQKAHGLVKKVMGLGLKGKELAQAMNATLRKHFPVSDRARDDKTLGHYAELSAAFMFAGLFDESKHPRGHEGNPGQFAKGGGHQGSLFDKKPAAESAPEAKPVDHAAAWKEHGTRAPAFKAWFGDWEKDPANASKVVDEATGEPLVMYRGSGNQNAGPYNDDAMIFLSGHKEVAEAYASHGGIVHELYVCAKKPFDASRGDGYELWKQYAKETNAPSYVSMGTERGALPVWMQEKPLRKWLDKKGIDYDAIYFSENDRKSSLAVLSANKRAAIGVLSATQIKSVTNRGTFDPANPHIEMAAEHAPKGGITLGSPAKQFRGGQFIPAAVMASASPEQKAKLEATKQAGAAKLKASVGEAGPDHAALREKLGQYSNLELKDHQVKDAKRLYNGIKSYHGDLALHRIHQLIHEDEAKLETAKPADKQRLYRRLKGFHHMLDWHEQGQAKAAEADTAAHTGVQNVPFDQLHVDPERFQYKQNTNKSGVVREGSALEGVKRFRPEFSGAILVWRDPADKKTYVVNGHHRHDLAKKAGQKNMAVLYMTGAKDAKEARKIGALANIAEGRGTAVDAAKLIRDESFTPESFHEEGVSLKGATAKNAFTLSKLADGMFTKLVRGQVD